MAENLNKIKKYTELSTTDKYFFSPDNTITNNRKIILFFEVKAGEQE